MSSVFSQILRDSRVSGIKTILLPALAAFMVAVVALLAPLDFTIAALHEKYERNGEAYMLIGRGDTRGVYKMNNVAGGVPTWMYDPKEAYGIKVDLDRNVYTFSLLRDVDFVPVSGNIKVRITYPPQTIDLRGLSTAPYGGGYYDGFTSLGRKWVWFGSAHMTHHFVWGRTSYPDFAIPTAAPGTTAGSSGWYFIPNGSIYHSMDNMWDQDENGDGVPDLVPYITRQGWWNYANGYYWRNHGYNINPTYVYLETQKAKNYDFHLLKWWEGRGAEPLDMGSKATAQERIINRSRVAGCTDGCFPGAREVNEGAAEQIMKVLVTGLGRPYFYKRTAGELNGQVFRDGAPYTGNFSGAVYNGSIVGNHNDLTTKFIGVSVKSRTEDYVYLLGENVIKSWIPSTFGSVDMDIRDIAVSDQWWQAGGIVYVYSDKNGIGEIYMFVRDENKAADKQDPPSRITVDSGIDDIAADGFGNLYYAKTSLEPADPANFDNTHVKQVTWDINTEYNFARAEVVYEQRTTKSVYMMDYYAGFTTSRKGEVVLGTTKWRRSGMIAPYRVGDSLPTNTLAGVDMSRFAWTDSPTKVNDGITINADEIPTELSVINVATPPQVVGFTPGKVDIDGVYDVLSTGELVSHNPLGFTFTAGPVYYFAVENAPVFDANGVNVVSRDLTDISSTHVTGGGYTGGFCSTVIESTMQYYWKITQLGVRMPDGSVQDIVIFPDLADQQWIDSPIMGLSFSSKGRYKVEVGVKYDWYDYSRLQYGDLMDVRDTVARLNNEWAVAPDGGNTAAFTFDINDDSADLVAQNAWVLMDSEDPLSHKESYFINEDTPHVFKVIDKPGLPAHEQVVSILSQAEPPDPDDPRYIADTKRWFTPLSITWKLNLKSPVVTENLTAGETLFEASLPQTSNFRTTIDGSNFSIPSDPYYYDLEVTVRRAYIYKIYAEMALRPGAPPIRRPMPRFKEYEVRASVRILARDVTPPAVEMTQTRLFATTGDSFPDVGAFAAGLSLPPAEDGTGRTENSNVIEVIVTDNNPFSSAAPIEPINGFESTSSRGHRQANRLSNFNHETSYLFPRNDGTGAVDQRTVKFPDAVAADPALSSRYGFRTAAELTGYYSCGDSGNGDSRFTFEKILLTDPDARKKSAKWKYTFPVTHRTFRDLIPDNPDAGKFPLNYEGSLNYGVKIYDTSGHEAGVSGIISVRDNDRPNCFIVLERLRDGISGGDRFRVFPGNLKADFTVDSRETPIHYFEPLAGKDTETWRDGTDLDFPSEMKTAVDGANTFRDSDGRIPIIDKGERLGIGCIVIDNIDGNMTINLFDESARNTESNKTLSDPDKLPIFIESWEYEYYDTVAGVWKPLSTEDSGGVPSGIPAQGGKLVFTTRATFRRPGMHRLIVQVCDRAKDWDNSRTLVRAASARANRRRVEFEFEVRETVLNVHTLQSN